VTEAQFFALVSAIQEGALQASDGYRPLGDDDARQIASWIMHHDTKWQDPSACSL
jgi:hypothetical protein